MTTLYQQLFLSHTSSSIIFAYKSCHSVKIPAEHNHKVIREQKNEEFMIIFCCFFLAGGAVLIVLFTCRTYPGCPSLTCRQIQVNIRKDWSKPCHSRSLSLSNEPWCYSGKSQASFDRPRRQDFSSSQTEGLLKTQPTQENWRKTFELVPDF